MQKQVLIIDDDPRNIFALTATLKSKGYSCFSASSAQQGLAFLAANQEIGIILIDMMMPEMDGYEAIPRIKDKYSIPVVAVTAQAMVGDKEKCLSAGADAYISKPISVDTLLEVMEEHIK